MERVRTSQARPNKQYQCESPRKATSMVDYIETNWLVLTCDEGAIDLAEQELKQVAAHSLVAAHLTPGVMLVDAQQTFTDVAAQWQASPPIFVRHIFPVQHIVALWDSPGDPDELAEALTDRERSITAALMERQRFSVQTRLFGELSYKPFDVNQAVSQAVASASGAALDVRAPEQVLSIVCVALSPTVVERLPRQLQPGPNAALYGLVGLSTPQQNLSDWAGGARRFAREEGQISRSEFKLLEAFEVFSIKLPVHGVALDLGASPGGWTRVLRQRGQYVTAVDPGALDERVTADAGVRHKRMTAETYLHDEPDQFDLIVNDMRMDGRDSARLMVAYARLLYPHGAAIMTLKLPETRRMPILQHALELLRQAYTVAGARQLFHNRSEITLYLRPNQPLRRTGPSL
jgi:23S rRNA (cytidine2498-2'-O)-methyltransferase